MVLLLTGTNGVLELFGSILIFILVLVACYYTTKWIGKTELLNHPAANISVLETYRIAPGKVIQIVKTGEKYIVIGVTKDHIEKLAELSKEEYTEKVQISKPDGQFGDILTKTMKDTFEKMKKKNGK